VDDPLDAKLAALKVGRNLLNGRWFRAAHWISEDKLVLLIDDNLSVDVVDDDKYPCVRYELGIERKNGDWVSSVAKASVKNYKPPR